MKSFLLVLLGIGIGILYAWSFLLSTPKPMPYEFGLRLSGDSAYIYHQEILIDSLPLENQGIDAIVKEDNRFFHTHVKRPVN